MCMWMRAHVCIHMNLKEYVQMSADVHISGERQMRLTDVSVFVRGCMWEEEVVEGDSRVHDVKMSNRHGSTMTALWVSSFSPSLPSSLLSPTFPKAQTLPVVTSEYCRPRWSTPLLGRRMSAQARGSFDKQSIYWYMIKYARNHPTAEGYYSFNIIIWINKHSVEK